MKLASAAALLANEFGKDAASTGMPRVECVKSYVVELWDSCFFWPAEPFLPGGQAAWTRWGDNTGHVGPDIPEVLLKFMKFTYDKSGKTIIVSDLQGVCDNGKYMLTDLAIHSEGQYFGNTDLGMRFVQNTYVAVLEELTSRRNQTQLSAEN